ncbi:MAG: YggS family pyridoxal phosphate-dependent enzyme [Syntrophomonadaceae bacterium]|nr:YggS family pyridoxal phosphate-dependent enzyme [Syntrophomonadaceae bacterium]
MINIPANIDNIKVRIERAARKRNVDPHSVTLIAVSKMVDIPLVEQVYSLGVKDFGENRVAELNRKRQMLPEANWHMIGRLQTNKVKDVVGNTCLIHSLDRWNLAEALNQRAEYKKVLVSTLLEVNISGEEQKAGIAPHLVKSFLSEIGQLKNLKVLGLMTLAPLNDNQEESRPIFRELYALRDQLIKSSFRGVDLTYLSMGMSQDFEVAVEEGSNMVRIGTSIFRG